MVSLGKDSAPSLFCPHVTEDMCHFAGPHFSGDKWRSPKLDTDEHCDSLTPSSQIARDTPHVFYSAHLASEEGGFPEARRWGNGTKGYLRQVLASLRKQTRHTRTSLSILLCGTTSVDPLPELTSINTGHRCFFDQA
jgi:hypothetical protein